MSQSPAVALSRPEPAVAVRLSVMMFLQYAIWGAWLPLLWSFLSGHRGFEAGQIGMMFSVGAVGALIAPFVAGQVADRYFPTERFLGISHVLGGLLVWQLASITTYSEFMWFSLAYSLVYSPTLSLTNSLSFHHLRDRDRDFGKVRLWGTVGWIAAGIGIGQWLLHMHSPTGLSGAELDKVRFAGMADAFRLSAILGIGLGLYCFTLPHTPPTRGAQKNATFEAIGEVLRQPLLTLFLLAVPVSCIHQFYFVHTSPFLGQYQSQAGGIVDSINSIFGVGGGGLMTIGQMSEILVLAAIPFVAKTMSRKALLAIGLAAYALRMAIFAFVGPIHAATGVPEVPLLMLGVALHGLCFGCFIFVAFLVIDENTSVDVRASAQTLFGLVVFGIGIIVGSIIAGHIATLATDAVTKAVDYSRLFAVPMWGALACLVVLLIAYPNRPRQTLPVVS
jgi:nucleoside transporter